MSSLQFSQSNAQFSAKKPDKLHKQVKKYQMQNEFNAKQPKNLIMSPSLVLQTKNTFTIVRYEYSISSIVVSNYQLNKFCTS